MASTGETVIAGIVFKKASGGVKGFKPWKKRYFHVTTKTLFIHKSEGQPPESHINLLDIRTVESLPDKRLGDRFDIILRNGTVFALHSASQAESMLWTRAIEKAISMAKQEEAEKEKKSSILDLPGREKHAGFSSFQRMFFDAWFGESKMSVDTSKDNFRESQAILSEIDREFSTESDVIRFLLLRFMSPALNIFRYESVEESKDRAGMFSMGSSVQEVCVHVGNVLGVKMEDTVKSFDDHLLYNVRDVIDSYIPSIIPQKIAAKIKEVLDEIKDQVKSSSGLESKIAPPPPSSFQAQDRIIAMVKSPQMMRNLVLVFNSKDTQAHGLAVRLLWAIYHATLPRARAILEFTSQVCVQSGGAHLSKETCEALLDIVLAGDDAICNLTAEMQHLQFNRQIVCAAALKPLLGVLKNSNLEFWKNALSDFTALLHENIKNSEQVVDGHDWQVWLLSLLTELRKDDKNTEPCKSIFALIVNNFTLVHYNFFARSTRFAHVIHSTMFRVHRFAGSNRDCQALLNIILGALVNKLTAQLKVFGSDFGGCEWINLQVLLTVVRKFVFQTAFLQTAPLLGQLKDKRELTNSEDEGEGLAETESDMFLLARRTLSKTERTWNSELIDVRDFGVHWAPVHEGQCVDIDLAKKMTTLLQKLGVSKCNDDILFGKQKQDRDTLIKLQAEFDFWEDATLFLQQLKREDISRRHLFSYRRLGHLCQSLCQESTKSGREAILKQLAQLQSGVGAVAEDDLDRQSLGESRHSREQSLSHLSLDENDASTSNNQPKASAAFSSPAMRQMQTGGNSPSVRPMSARHNNKPSNGGLHKSANSISSSCSDSCGSGSCSGSSQFSKAPSPPTAAVTPKHKPISRPDDTPNRGSLKGVSTTLLASLSADLGDE